MVNPWIFPKLDAARGDAGFFDYEHPWRIVLHTTEVTRRIREWVPNWLFPSQVVCDPLPSQRDIIQCLRLDRAGKSLVNASGGVNTNTINCIQVEINGISASAEHWDDEWLTWIGAEVIAPIIRWIRAVGGDIDLSQVTKVGPVPTNPTQNKAQRMSFNEWNNFNGICAHVDVPENDHLDTKLLNRDRIVSAAKLALDPVQTKRKRTNHMNFTKRPGGPVEFPGLEGPQDIYDCAFVPSGMTIAVHPNAYITPFNIGVVINSVSIGVSRVDWGVPALIRVSEAQGFTSILVPHEVAMIFSVFETQVG